jgi:low temperature requirement protein LtrA
MSPTPTATTRSRLMPMRPRDPHEPGRTASSLELFFDLVFVVAVSIASAELHESLTDGNVRGGLVAYGIVFFGIWWAWMNFTWFATSFDTDDWLYRALTIVQMSGVLVLAAGIAPAFDDGTLTLLVAGYVVMRVAMVAQWLRASRAAGTSRRATLTYAAGIASAQVLWLLMLTLRTAPTHVALVLLIAAELAIPLLAERQGTTPWHPRHLTERYGLFTLILLGESLLGSANAIIEALHNDGSPAPLISMSVLTLAVTAALWWIYFWPPHHQAISTLGSSLRYGYVHYAVFAAAGGVSAGIDVQIDALTNRTKLSDLGAAFTLTVPIAVFMLGIWWIALRGNADSVVNTAVPLSALLVLLSPLTAHPLSVTALLMTLTVAVLVLHPPLPRDQSKPATTRDDVRTLVG